MIWKIFMGSLLAVFGAAALLLVTTTGGATSAAEATVHSITRSPTIVSPSATDTPSVAGDVDGESIISIVADDGNPDATADPDRDKDLRILATVGKLSPTGSGCTTSACD